MRVQSLGREDPLEKEMATHSSIPAWRIPWTEEPGCTVHSVEKSWTQLKWLSMHTRMHTAQRCGQVEEKEPASEFQKEGHWGRRKTKGMWYCQSRRWEVCTEDWLEVKVKYTIVHNIWQHRDHGWFLRGKFQWSPVGKSYIGINDEEGKSREFLIVFCMWKGNWATGGEYWVRDLGFCLNVMGYSIACFCIDLDDPKTSMNCKCRREKGIPEKVLGVRVSELQRVGGLLLEKLCFFPWSKRNGEDGYRRWIESQIRWGGGYINSFLMVSIF